MLDSAIARSIVVNTTVPVVFRGYVNNWSICEWSVEKWAEVFGEREVPFRCMLKDYQSDEPCWERKCEVKKMTFKKFAEEAPNSDEWRYFDYKYLHDWFSADDELYKEISWNRFGYMNKGAKQSTLWVGSVGAHTPAHQDTYGVNVVAQVHGKKRWILFPPETEGMKSTRVPYEESSVYSELNFYCPVNVQAFKDLTGARVVELSAGDALVVPHGWWHYVQNEDTVNISLNMWLAHEQDKQARLGEALIKMYVGHVAKKTRPETIRMIINPNELGLHEISLSALYQQLQVAANQCRGSSFMEPQRKRQRTGGNDEPTTTYDFKTLVDDAANNLAVPAVITGEALVKLVEENKMRFVDGSKPPRPERDCERCSDPLGLANARNLINTFCEGGVLNSFNQHLAALLG